MSCAGVIKQALNYSFWTIQYTCFVISSIMSKLCLLLRPNVAWTNGTNLSLIDEVAMIKWVTWESYISQTSLVTYVFYCTFQLTIMWRAIEKNLKKILRQLLLLRNHLNNYSSSPNGLWVMRPKAEWAIDSDAMRAWGIIVLVKFN